MLVSRLFLWTAAGLSDDFPYPGLRRDKAAVFIARILTTPSLAPIIGDTWPRVYHLTPTDGPKGPERLGTYFALSQKHGVGAGGG